MMEAISQFFVDWGYIGLFLSALVAGSILPFSSEAVLAVLVQMGADPVICLLSASVGNTLGGLLCYWLGYLGDMSTIERWLKIDGAKIAKVEGFVRKRGAWMGVFGVLPWVGRGASLFWQVDFQEVILPTLGLLLVDRLCSLQF